MLCMQVHVKILQHDITNLSWNNLPPIYILPMHMYDLGPRFQHFTKRKKRERYITTMLLDFINCVVYVVSTRFSKNPYLIITQVCIGHQPIALTTTLMQIIYFNNASPKLRTSSWWHATWFGYYFWNGLVLKNDGLIWLGSSVWLDFWTLSVETTDCMLTSFSFSFLLGEYSVNSSTWTGDFPEVLNLNQLFFKLNQFTL